MKRLHALRMFPLDPRARRLALSAGMELAVGGRLLFAHDAPKLLAMMDAEDEENAEAALFETNPEGNDCLPEVMPDGQCLAVDEATNDDPDWMKDDLP